jgi:CheY-like chemotaxis protein
MDLNMPVMNGWQAANKIRSLEKLNAPGQSPLPTIPIIAVTAFGSPQDQAKCLSSGFDLVLLKPVSISKLREAFEKLHITTNKD